MDLNKLTLHAASAALDAGEIDRIDDIAGVKVAEQFRRAAQAHRDLVYQTVADDEAAGKTAVFHTQFHLRFHMISTDHEVPEARGDDEGEQSRKDGLPAGITG